MYNPNNDDADDTKLKMNTSAAHQQIMVARKVGINKQKIEEDISKRIEGRGSID